MAGKSVEDSIFEGEDFKKTWDNFQLSSVYGTLEGENNINRVFGGEVKEGNREIVNFCRSFEKKYNKKLNFEIEGGFYYFFYPKNEKTKSLFV